MSPRPSCPWKPSFPEPLAQGVRLHSVQRGEFAHHAAARNVSPRVGHLHIIVDDLPWAWADYGQSDTIILVNLPRSEHNVLIEVVDPEGGLLTAQTVKFKSPGKPAGK